MSSPSACQTPPDPRTPHRRGPLHSLTALAPRASPKHVHVPERMCDQRTPNRRHPHQGPAARHRVTGSSLPPEVAARPGTTGTVALTQEGYLAHAGGLPGTAGSGGAACRCSRAAVAAWSPPEVGPEGLYQVCSHYSPLCSSGTPKARTAAPLSVPGGEQHRPQAGPHSPAKPVEATALGDSR